MKEKIKKWYMQGLWSKEMVQNAVEKSIITAEDYKENIGEEYPVAE